jgi:hypothetical protein
MKDPAWIPRLASIQVLPPSVVRYGPSCSFAMNPRLAYMVFGSNGSNATSLPTLNASPELLGCHVEPRSTVMSTPLFPSAAMIRSGSFGSEATWTTKAPGSPSLLRTHVLPRSDEAATPSELST